MKAGEAKVRDVLRNSNWFTIPKFQRQYVWGTVEQRALWDAVREQHDLLKKGVASNRPDRFIGAVVIHRLPSPSRSASDPDRFSIIDGQQRLLTICTLLAALRDLTIDPETDRRKFDLFTSTHLQVKLASGRDRMIIEPQKADALAFEEIVNRSDVSDDNHPLSLAYWNAREWIGALMRRDKSGFRSERLVNAILERLGIVEIKLESRDNAHRVFYSLNSLGKPLSRAEKVKTLFAMMAGAKADQLFDAYWQPMQDELETDARLQDYLLTRLIMDRKAVNRPQIESTYTEQLSGLEAQPTKVLAEARRLSSGTTTFLQTISEVRHPVAAIDSQLASLHDWGVVPAWPVMNLLVDLHRRGKLTSGKTVKALALLEAFLVRRFVTGIPPNDLRSRLTDITVKLPHSSEIVAELAAALKEEGNRLFDDKELTRRVLTQPIYEPRNAKQLLFVFDHINRSIQGMQAPHLADGKYHIEHVLPQSDNQWLPDLRKWGVKDIDDLSRSRLHVLGNLTPLYGPANSGAGNLRLRFKQERYYSKSTIMLTHRLAAKSVKEWTEKEIDNRSRWLAGKIVALWPI